MAGSRFTSAITFLSLASAALAAPLTSANSANVLERRGDDICSATSDCIPFTIELTWGGVDATGAGSRGAILTNGSMPGPALRMKVGECVDFKVINNLEVDTGVHFHGIQQTGTPWADGVPGLSQYAIQAGDTYMYRWTADEQGGYFYHSHYKGQMMDGLYGAIFVSPSDDEETPFSAIDSSAVDKLKLADAKTEPIFISDWSKYTFDQFFAVEQAGNVDIACADALILNGMGSQTCLSRDQITALSPPPIAKLTNGAGYTLKGCLPANTPATQGNFTRNLAAIPADVYDTCTPSTGKTFTLNVDQADGYAAMTFISPSGFALLKASIAGHKMWVYNYNGHYVTPQKVDQINVSNGDRVSVFVKLDQAVGDYQIQVSNLGLNQIISGFGTLSYKGSAATKATSSSLLNYAGNALSNTTTVVPFRAAKAAPVPAVACNGDAADRTFFFNIQKLSNQPDAYRWTLQGKTAYDMSRDDGTPLLYQDPSTIEESDIVKKTNHGEWVDIIMQTTGPLAQPHPIHKHANKFFMIGQGSGSFNWSSVAEAVAYNASMFNFNNPPYVDGYTTLAAESSSTWTVFRYQVEVPGAWFLHCHMQTHFSGGMAIAILDGVDKWPSVPSDAGKVCQGNGSSNSTWNPSCSCPAACPANSGKGPDGTGEGNGPNTGSSSSGSSTDSGKASGNASGSGNGSGSSSNSGESSGNGSGSSSNSGESSGNGSGSSSSSGESSSNTDSSNSSSSSTSTWDSSSTGSWENGVWVGNSNNPSTGDVTSSNGEGSTSYTPNPSTGSYGGNSTSPIKTFTGAASSSNVSLFTLLALAIAALSL
ncbi:hypothetical protein LTR70_005953 [Exophiala xenobiotica]|uniref:Laccase n=1 Tax=Lithohypha guttulata TaxID=1690604 RepID=A0ABR0K6Q0_9EURO|nr:hypothetical protein LTR24_006185 [Lithohypha guttulata]KAK5317213.1 hypothetical protein LTR70_005953 [Exophiala xenobiotica]